jgi:Lhr-like helicase
MDLGSNNISSRKRINYFSPEEDEIIRNYVYRFGSNSFQGIKKYFPNRTVDVVRERWKKYLDPAINKLSFSKEEDDLLKEKVSLYGTKWNIIAQYFHHRTDIKLKYRYKQLQRQENYHHDKRFLNQNSLLITQNSNMEETESEIQPISQSTQNENLDEIIEENTNSDIFNEFAQLFDQSYDWSENAIGGKSGQLKKSGIPNLFDWEFGFI